MSPPTTRARVCRKNAPRCRKTTLTRVSRLHYREPSWPGGTLDAFLPRNVHVARSVAVVGGHIQPEETWRMEQFSRAYVKAVASVAACSVEWSTVDNDSVDGTLRRKTIDTPVRSPQLDLQLKATTQDCIQADHVAFALSMKNYTELRATN